MSSNPKYVILLLIITLISYLAGLLIEKSNKTYDNRLRKFIMIISILCNIAILFVFKYYNFFTTIIIRILSIFHFNIHIQSFNHTLPIGISFYTFEAIAYIIDIYRGDIKAEKNLGKFATFIAFFPQLLAGPIERAKHMLCQFDEKHSFEYQRIKRGLLLILWGLFQKLVVADRLSKLVDNVFASPNSYKGFEVIIASIFFTFQIYCDFSGYSDMAIGVAGVLGFELSRNFRQPYFSKSIREFWRRWHITLCAWFKDYLYIPLGGNRCSPIKNYRNIMIVFIVSGLWHGSALNFIVWGTLHGIYQVIEKVSTPLKNKLIERFKIRTETFGYKLMQVLITFALVDFAWIFFKADSFKNAMRFIRNMFYFNPGVLTNGDIFKLGLSYKDFYVAVVGIFVILIANLLQRKDDLYEKFLNKNMMFRWSTYLIAVMVIIIFGVYGPEYNPSQFIYFHF